MSSRSKKELIEAIKSASKLSSEEPLIQRTFFANSDITISDVLQYFPKWSDACRAAGVKYDTSRDRKNNEDLLSDWGQVCRRLDMYQDLPNTKFTVNIAVLFLTDLDQDYGKMCLKLSKNSPLAMTNGKTC